MPWRTPSSGPAKTSGPTFPEPRRIEAPTRIYLRVVGAEPSSTEGPSHPLLDELRGLDLPDSEYVIFGSGPLLARGWIAEVGDLDILARGEAWARAQQLGIVEYLDEWDVTVVNIGPNITVGTRWAIGDVDVDALIDGAETVAGLPFAALEAVIAYKRLSDRPKDREHLAIIERLSPMTARQRRGRS